MLVTSTLGDGWGAMGDEDEIRRLHAGLEQLATEVAELRARLDDRDEAMDRAISGQEKPPWAPRLLCGTGEVAAAGALAHTAALVALTAVSGAAAVTAATVPAAAVAALTRE